MDGEAETRELGRAGEEAALAHYLRSGYRLLARNWRCPLGEVDLVLARGPVVVFCEVKARRGSRLGGAHEAVTWRKQRKLRQLAEAFLASGAAGRDEGRAVVRFDVASVTVRPDGRASVHLFEDAF
ncbi:MAG TPA: YraN family protein [Actinomycetota bacterium]|nr:YraN family protein [Actinomycetota bacterium]